MLSVVIPVWTGTQVLLDMHIALCKSVRDDCDELIVCEDGNPYQGLEKYCDKYIVHDERLGHAQNLQLGINAARHEYIGVLDSDVVIKSGSLRDLCNHGRFTEARSLTPTDKKGFIIWCSVAPRVLWKLFPLPTDKEILDDWADSIPKELIYGSFLVTYEHNTGIGFAEWQKVHRTEINLGLKNLTGFRR
jgi:glycosyltransferase involved in cell wall biosynthesis